MRYIASVMGAVAYLATTFGIQLLSSGNTTFGSMLIGIAVYEIVFLLALIAKVYKN